MLKFAFYPPGTLTKNNEDFMLYLEIQLSYGRIFKEILRNRLSLTSGWPEVPVILVVQVLNRRSSLGPFNVYLYSENQWKRMCERKLFSDQ